MNIKIFMYAFFMVVTTFTMSGINFTNFFKKDHVWEARFFIAIVVLSVSYILTSFSYDIVEIFRGFM